MELWDKFVELEKRHFSFLETNFQFRRKEEKRPFVWYESDKVKVGIYYGEWRHELDFGIRRQGDSPQTFPNISPEGLVRLTDWREAEKISFPAYPKTEEALEIEVPRLAEILKKYGSKILNADPSEFARLERLRKEAAEKINEQTKYAPKSRFRQ